MARTRGTKLQTGLTFIFFFLSALYKCDIQFIQAYTSTYNIYFSHTAYPADLNIRYNNPDYSPILEYPRS